MFSDLENTVVMMDVEAGEYYDVDEVGAHIWKLLDQPITFEALCARLSDDFEVDGDTCRSDVGEFLDEVAKLGLVTLS